MGPDRFSQLFGRVKGIIESARATAAKSVNTAQVVSNWLIGREIVQEEQHGSARARYGERLLEALSGRLVSAYGRGYSIQNLRYFRQFFLTYSAMLGCSSEIRHTLCGESRPANGFNPALS
ncbi:MAG: DUF1016 N-terminal domain-containing protein [Elusimicrobiota bacterium]